MVYSSSFIFAQERTGDGFSFIKKQVLFASAGFLGLAYVSRLDHRKWLDWSLYGLIAVTVMLAIVQIPGVGARVGGAQRWIRFHGIQFQPAELAKFALVLFVARQLYRKNDRLERFGSGVLAQFLLILPALALLLVQPDFGSVVMIVLAVFALMFVAGVPKKFLFGLVGAGLAVGAALVIQAPYRLARLMTFIDPWKDPQGKGFQILQSMVGVHQGDLLGMGLGNGKEKLFYLPEAHNDFIFAVIGEELGFVGIACVTVAFLFVMFRGLKIGWMSFTQNGDRFGMYLACGITFLLSFQAFINMGVVLGLMPTKGLTLPFISYGGSALMVNLVAVGILLSISRRIKQKATAPGNAKKHVVSK